MVCAALVGWPASPRADAQTPSPAFHETAARAAIGAAYDQIDAAYRRHDLAQVLSYFTPDYVQVDPNGAKRDHDQLRRQYQDWLNSIRTMQTRWVIESVTPTGGGDLVDMRMHTDGTGVKRVLFAHVRGTFTNDLVVRDLWVETPEGWRLKHRQTLLDQTHIHMP